MAVREFDGSTDDVVRATGACSGLQYGTIVTLVKFDGFGDFNSIIGVHDSGGSLGTAIYTNVTFGDLRWETDATDEADGGPSPSAGDWFLIVARKATGTAAPRYSIYNLNTDTWTHDSSADSIPNATAPGVGGSIGFNYAGTADLDGRVAAQACWSNSLPWTANASGDSAIEAAGLETWAKNWIDNSPSAMWRFNQDSIATPVPDDTGNGADQSSISGTNVVTGDDPPGFNFSIAADVANADAQAATVATAANNAMASVGPLAETATVSTVANNATVTVTGEPDGITATVAVTANNATVDAVGDAVNANAIAATVSVVANDGMQDVGVHAVTATVATAAQGATPTSQSQASANRATVSVNALDATITVESEVVTATAQVATVGVAANDATPTGEANATATAATVSVTANAPSRQAGALAAIVAVDAHGASAAADAGVIGHAREASVAVSALDATITVSETITTGAFTARVSVTANNAGVTIDQPPLPMYTFFPPTVIEHFEHLQDTVFERKFTWEKGVSVVRKNGTFENTRFVVPDIGGPDDLLIDGVDYFVGGFHYIIPEPIALELIAAGYEPELIE